jgi:hypothetical protein
MKKSILEVYSLAVCFVTVACFAITTGIMLYQFVRTSDPEFTLNSYQYERLGDNDRFWKDTKPRCSEYDKEGCGDGGKRPPEDELTKKRGAVLEVALRNEVRNAKQSLVRCLFIILVDIFVFFPHWVLARRARESVNG